MRNTPLFFFVLGCLVLLGGIGGCTSSTDGENASLNFAVNTAVRYPLPKDADSLQTILLTLSEDTNRVNVLNGLARVMELNGEYDKGMEYAQQSKLLAEKLNFQKGLANAYGNIGNLFYRKGENNLALENHTIALKIDEKIDNRIGIQKRLGNIGNVHYSQGNFDLALEFQYRALAIATELNNKSEIAKNLSNMGLIYVEEANYPKALECYLNALKINEEMGDKRNEALCLGNIGIVYDDLDEYDKSLSYYMRALKMDEDLGYRNGIIKQLGNIGNVFFDKGETQEALNYYFRALKIAKELGDKRSEAINLGNIGSAYYRLFKSNEKNTVDSGNVIRNQSFNNAMNYYLEALGMNEANGDKTGMAINLGNIGGLYGDVGKYDRAFPFLYRGLAIADSIGDKINEKACYEFLSVLYENSNIALQDSIGGKMLNTEQMRLRSLYYYKLSISISDSLYSDENKKQLVRKEMNYEFDKKEAATKSENDKREALSKEELKSKEEQRNYFVGGFILVGLLAGFIFRGYRQKQKANAIISHQKELVDEKQKEILDSIHYANKIQQSMMPTERFVQKTLYRLKNNDQL